MVSEQLEPHRCAAAVQAISRLESVPGLATGFSLLKSVNLSTFSTALHLLDSFTRINLRLDSYVSSHALRHCIGQLTCPTVCPASHN